MYKIMFSICAHEKYESLIDLIENINFYNPGSAIVIHLAKKFNESELCTKDKFLEIISKMPNVYINSESIETSTYSQMNCHLLNYRYLKDKNIEFEYLSICNTNDYYLKSGLYDYIKDYDALIMDMPLKKNWSHYKDMESNLDFMDYLNNALKGIKLYQCMLEGNAYKKEVFDKIYDNITSHLDIYHIYNFSIDEVLFTSLGVYYSKNYKSGQDCQIGFLGDYYINRHYIKICLKKNEKFSVKRINRPFYDYQRIYVRDKIQENTNIYNELCIEKKNVSFIKYWYLDIKNTLWTIVRNYGHKVKIKIKGAN